MTIEEIKKWMSEQEATMMEHQIPPKSHQAIRFLLAEVERLSNSLTAIDKELRGYVNDPDPLPNTFPQAARRTTTYGLVAGIRRERDSLQALSAARLADQEAIERHTRKQIYRELYEIRYEPDKLLCKIERECSPYIRQKYGVE